VPRPDLVIALRSQGEVDVGDVGSKGHNLIRLHREGFEVPDGFVITTAAIEQLLAHNGLLDRAREGRLEGMKEQVQLAVFTDELEERILDAFDALGSDRSAVRSSGISEDLAARSFAGQYESLLDVEKDALLDAVKECLASAFNRPPEEYTKDLREQGFGFAVIVQRMLTPSVAGVCFTREPTTGMNYAVIEASAGLGTAVVSGTRRVDTFVIQVRDRLLISKNVHGNEVLDTRQLLAIADRSLAVQDSFGTPQDIEWAFEDDRLYLLQARDITTIEEPVPGNSMDTPIDPDYPIYTSANIGEVLPGAITPVTWSTLGEVLQKGFVEAERYYGIHDEATSDQVFLGYFSNRVFLNLAYLCAQTIRIPGTSVEDLKRTILGENDTYAFEPLVSAGNRLSLRSSATFLAQSQAFFLSMARLVEQNERDIELLLDRRPARANPVGCRENLRRFIHTGIETARLHFLISQFSSKITGNFFQFCKTVFDDDHHAIATSLTSGHDELESLKPIIELERLAGTIAGDSLLSDLFERDTRDIITIVQDLSFFREFLHRYGYRGPKEAEMRADSWETDPSLVVDILKLYLRDPPSQHGPSPEVSVPVLPLLSKVRLTALLRLELLFSKYRERQKSNLIRLANFCRKNLRALASNAAHEGQLDSEDDIYFLTLQEILALDEKKEDLGDRIATRRREFEANSALASFPSIIDSRVVLTECEDAASTGGLAGIPCYPGRISGRARVVLDPTSSGLRRGEVLVAPVIDAGWSPLFALASAIVADKGGLLSHGAIIARELKVPTIVDVQGATHSIQDGDLVIVDANTGTVSIKGPGGGRA
jgi:pyruvate,water dikinase